MRRAMLLIGLLPTLGGCATHLALRDDTVRTSNTLTDLQYKQVLDNVARFQDDPDTVPSFAVTTAGTVSLLDTDGRGRQPHLLADPHVRPAGRRGVADPLAALPLHRLSGP